VTFGFRGEVLDVARGNLLPREALHVWFEAKLILPRHLVSYVAVELMFALTYKEKKEIGGLTSACWRNRLSSDVLSALTVMESVHMLRSWWQNILYVVLEPLGSFLNILSDWNRLQFYAR
jgi:hypothetical protein